MKIETIEEHAIRLLGIGEGALKRCKTIEAKRRIRKTNKYLKEVIKIGSKSKS